MRILVTVGMGPWPFDRLLEVVKDLVNEHDVFVQHGTSATHLPCPHTPFLSFDQLQERIGNADVVITHAGNTVRLVQRTGKVPIVVARMAKYREMNNDHQVEYLREEEQVGRVIAVWNTDELSMVVKGYKARAQQIVQTRPAPKVQSGEALKSILDELCAKWIQAK